MSQVAVESMPHQFLSFTSAAPANPKWSSGLRTRKLNSSPAESKAKVHEFHSASPINAHPLVLLSKASKALKNIPEKRQQRPESPASKPAAPTKQETIPSTSQQVEKKRVVNVWGVFGTRENFNEMHIC
ncbi:hypothetical protein RvY_05488 [Ramazzottius varieornatus]|uniref:Uncharacterized protein n=1 Tax=Ramazzottius varieornatus TaxID=947166 RepID=A0A1D1V468_RAMVA|nr:hypothetical protein RvY_05488 [Ramazzottius varieornatus]